MRKTLGAIWTYEDEFSLVELVDLLGHDEHPHGDVPPEVEPLARVDVEQDVPEIMQGLNVFIGHSEHVDSA